ncbi:MAG TPA: DUF4249 domain-containing protein, partial [Mucilaginibacter sp.]|nr:DUF4249 domain-containing protein [Mucilaginibacter sp.]
MRVFAKILIFLCLYAILITCKKPYAPVIAGTGDSYLVVDGFINSGSDSTFIRLSRTVSLDSKNYDPETGATISIESDKNDTYFLTEISTGVYAVNNLNLPTDRKYRLHIITADHKEYASDFVENKISPPIDSISTKVAKNGVQFFVNTHDDSGKTRYYYFDYDEAWTYFAALYSNLNYVNHQV